MYIWALMLPCFIWKAFLTFAFPGMSLGNMSWWIASFPASLSPYGVPQIVTGANRPYTTPVQKILFLIWFPLLVRARRISPAQDWFMRIGLSDLLIAVAIHFQLKISREDPVSRFSTSNREPVSQKSKSKLPFREGVRKLETSIPKAAKSEAVINCRSLYSCHFCTAKSTAI